MIEKLEKVIWVFGGLAIAGILLLVIIGSPSGILRNELVFDWSEEEEASEEDEGNSTNRASALPKSNSKTTHKVRHSSTAAKSGKRPATPRSKQKRRKAGTLKIPTGRKFREKYSRPHDAMEAVKGDYSKFVTLPDGRRLLKILKLRPNSILTELGLKSNDLIEDINGITFSNPDEGWDLYNRLKDETSFVVNVLRDNVPTSLEYHIPK